MKTRCLFLLLFLSTVILLTPSCERTETVSDPNDSQGTLEERLVVGYDETQTDVELASFVGTPIHPIFARLLGDMGYTMRMDESAHFEAYDPLTGKTGHMLLIPCTLPDDDSRVAMIEFFRVGNEHALTASEYFSWEDYQIAHPIDEAAALALIGSDISPVMKYELLQGSERSKTYWRCVTKRFIAGCAGCATACWLTGPGWGACTAECCAGSAVVALISCAFTIYFGW
jgi:hypothetical protein